MPRRRQPNGQLGNVQPIASCAPVPVQVLQQVPQVVALACENGVSQGYEDAAD